MAAVRYLSQPEFAERVGVARDTLSKYRLPDADAYVGRLPGWLPETVDAWHASRPGRGRWGAREKATEDELVAKLAATGARDLQPPLCQTCGNRHGSEVRHSGIIAGRGADR